MHGHERTDHAESQTQPAAAELELSRTVPRYVHLGEKRLEEVRQLLGGDADAVIADLQTHRSALAPAAHFDGPAVGCELDGVNEQMIKTDADFPCFHVDDAEVRGQIDDKPLPPLLDKETNAFDGLADQGGAIRRPTIEGSLETARTQHVQHLLHQTMQ